MRDDYKSELTDQDCRVIVDHLLTDKHRKLVIADLVNFYRTMRKGISSWHAGHYQFRVRIETNLYNRPNTRVEKNWIAGRCHIRDTYRFK